MSSQVQANSSAQSFSVQTFNLYGPLYGRALGKRSRDFVSEIQRGNVADFNFYQEVWSQDHLDYLEGELKQNPDQSWIRFDEARDDRTSSGLAAFLQWGQVNEVSSQLFQKIKKGFLDELRDFFGVWKGFGILRLRDPETANRYLFINTHLHPTSQIIRLCQLVTLSNWMLENAAIDESVFFVGDFNSGPGSLEWDLITKFLGFEDPFNSVNLSKVRPCTYCASTNPLAWGENEDRILDNVFFLPSPEVDLRATNAIVNYNEERRLPISDHYGVRVDFEIEGLTSLGRIELTSRLPSLNRNPEKVIEAFASLEPIAQLIEKSGTKECRSLIRSWKSRYSP